MKMWKKKAGLWVKRERRTGNYKRSLKLGNIIDQEKVSAEYVDGVLTLTLPKAEAESSRKIEVTVH